MSTNETPVAASPGPATPQPRDLDAKALALQAAADIAMKAELKRLREEHVQYRKLVDQYRKLEAEVEYLRGATLMQHEEKVPIRLRQLEQENLKLRKINASLDERVKTLESEEYRQRLSDHQRFFAHDIDVQIGSRSRNTDAARQEEEERQRLLGMTGGSSGQGGSNTNNVIVGQKSVVVIKGGTGPCTNCRLKLSVAQTAHNAEKDVLMKQVADLQQKLDAATTELEAINRWVQHVVSVHTQYPSLAQRLPTSSIVSPQRDGSQMTMTSPGFNGGWPDSQNGASPINYLDAQRATRRGGPSQIQVGGTALPYGQPPQSPGGYGSR